jgi:hypothetical protein
MQVGRSLFWRYVPNLMHSLDQINGALGTRLTQETFNAWARSLRARIESLLRARKKRKISHVASKSFSSIRHGCGVISTASAVTNEGLQFG